MAEEIERKFLVKNDTWRDAVTSATTFRQGYLSTQKERTVRVRIKGDKAYLTIKGITRGITRAEYEYEIPANDANELLDELCERPLIEKTRHEVTFAGMLWEIDEFHGDNAGLLIAEVELRDAGQALEMPDWAGEEVSDDPRYYNANLVSKPYTRWSE